VRVVADGIEAGQRKATPEDFAQAKNGAGIEETPPTPEGDSEQVPAGDEQTAEEAPVAEEVRTNG